MKSPYECRWIFLETTFQQQWTTVFGRLDVSQMPIDLSSKGKIVNMTKEEWIGNLAMII
jgi:hypothetical protein